MATIRIGTFNVENLFARYKFNKDVDPQKAVIDGWGADQRHFDICIVLPLAGGEVRLRDVQNKQ